MNSTVSTPQGFVPSSRFGAYDFTDSGPSGPFAPTEPQSNDIDDDVELLTVAWNQDYTCFAAGTSRGFQIYSCDPFRETFRRDLKNGGFGLVEMLFRSNILGLVGGGIDSQYSPNKVMIWDDHQSRCVGEFSFRSEVRAVRLRRDRIVIVVEHKVYVYNFLDLKLLHQIDTVSNPRGLCSLSHQVNTFVLACPGRRRGQVRVEHFGLEMTKTIDAHESQLACITLTSDGLILATASTKGTLIRVFNTMDGTCLQEVRRGTEKAEIYGIAFSTNVQWLAVSSDRGTVHIFSLRVRVAGEIEVVPASPSPSLFHQNSSSSLEPLITQNTGANPSLSVPLKGVLPKYFSSEWSFARFHLPENARCIVAFGSNNTINIAGLDGSFYKCRFDPNIGGEMSQLEYVRFLKTDGRSR